MLAGENGIFLVEVGKNAHVFKDMKPSLDLTHSATIKLKFRLGAIPRGAACL